MVDYEDINASNTDIKPVNEAASVLVKPNLRTTEELQNQLVKCVEKLRDNKQNFFKIEDLPNLVNDCAQKPVWYVNAQSEIPHPTCKISIHEMAMLSAVLLDYTREEEPYSKVLSILHTAEENRTLPSLIRDRLRIKGPNAYCDIFRGTAPKSKGKLYFLAMRSLLNLDSEVLPVLHQPYYFHQKGDNYMVRSDSDDGKMEKGEETQGTVEGELSSRNVVAKIEIYHAELLDSFAKLRSDAQSTARVHELQIKWFEDRQTIRDKELEIKIADLLDARFNLLLQKGGQNAAVEFIHLSLVEKEVVRDEASPETLRSTKKDSESNTKRQTQAQSESSGNGTPLMKKKRPQSKNSPVLKDLVKK